MNGIERLLDVMRRLRDPHTGCPWDLQQTFETIAPYTIEEAYEVSDAIAGGRPQHIRDELGDLLFQVAFHAQLAAEQELFDFDAVAHGIAEKMIRRHPHVFADVEVSSTAEVNELWESHKAAERIGSTVDGQHSRLDGVALSLPALLRAEKLQRRAARAGFDWPALPPVIDKIEEELAEVIDAVERVEPRQIHEEIGDLLFSVVNLARHSGVDAETALRDATTKFMVRFKQVEALAEQQGDALESLTPEQLDHLWQQVKRS